MIEAAKLPYDTFYKINHFRSTSKDEDKRVTVRTTDKLGHALIEHGYLAFHPEDAVEEWIDTYQFYRPTEKFAEATDEEVLKELTGFALEEVMKNKTISIKEVPWDWDEAFESLIDSDGFMSHTDLSPSAFKGILEFHGFATASGRNGAYSSGTQKLKDLVHSGNAYRVIEAITGKTEEENTKILENERKEKDLKEMFEIAEKYGYSVSKKEEKDL